MRKKKVNAQYSMENKKDKKLYLRVILVLFVVISFFFWYLRLRNFEKMMTFHTDQGFHIQEVYDMVVQRKARLIGPIVLTRMVEGKGYFIGPYYYYILAILCIVSKWDAVSITKFLLIWWWAGAVFLFLWIGKKLNCQAALFVYAILTVHPLLIGFSRMFLNPNFLPLISVGFFYFLWKALKEKRKKDWFIAGGLAGVGLSFHFSVLVWLGIMAGGWAYGWFVKKVNIGHLLTGFIGIALSELPYLIFELRHNFYNLRTIRANGFDPNEVGFLGPYYAFGFFPIIFWAIAFLYTFVAKRTKYWISIPLSLLILWSIMFVFTKDEYKEKGYGMPIGWSVPTQKYLAGVICNDQSRKNFNIATHIRADVRGDDLRWWVRRCGAEPMGYGDYPFADTLYFVDRGELQSLNAPGLWELASMTKDPHEVEVTKELDGDLWFYKLVRKK